MAGSENRCGFCRKHYHTYFYNNCDTTVRLIGPLLWAVMILLLFLPLIPSLPSTNMDHHRRQSFTITGNVCYVDDELSSASLSSSSSSSSLSGIPTPWKPKKVVRANQSTMTDNSSSIPTHTENDDNDNSKSYSQLKSKSAGRWAPCRKREASSAASQSKCIDGSRSSINDDDDDNNNDSTIIKASSKVVITKSLHDSDDEDIDDDDDEDSDDDDDTTTAEKHFHCYLLRSLDPKHPLKTYIGFTTHPQRRIRQHNGLLKSGGARRTRKAGRPWTFVCIIHGFQDKITALQFEWAWQHVHKSKSFRAAINNDDMLAKKMKRRNGPTARLDELRILLMDCLPYSLFSLTVYFPEQKYYDIFNGMLKRGKDGNPYKKDYNYNDNNSTKSEQCHVSSSLMTIEICSLENMPFAKELTILKERKKAKQEAAKIHKLEQNKLNNKRGGGVMKKTTMKNTTDYESDISDWLENAKLIAEDDGCWSDLLENDDENDNESTTLNTIDENDDLFVDMCDDDGSSESSISSMEKSCLLVDDTDDERDSAFDVMKEPPERYEKENHELKNSTPNSGKLRSSTRSNCDIVDLCSP